MSLDTIGLPFGDDPARLGAALDRFLSVLGRTPPLLGLGEPTHGVAAFPLLRDQALAHLVDHHGFRSIAVESDCLAGLTVDDYVTGGAGEIDDILASGFSHGFGALPGARDLVTWLRDRNAGRDPAEQVRFYGFDGPVETEGASSPRAALMAAHAYLTAHLDEDLPYDAETLLALLGDDAEWTNPAAMTDPSQSVGDSERAHALRVAADEILVLVETHEPGLRRTTSDAAFERAHLAARTALDLVRYHATTASAAPTRIAAMCGRRAAMMAANLQAIARTERRRGPCLVFAHNAHLQRGQSYMMWAGTHLRWWSAGALTAAAVGDDYAVIASDADLSRPAPGSLLAVLAEVTGDRAIFPARDLAAALDGRPGGLRPWTSPDFRHVPLQPHDLEGVDGIAFIRVGSVPDMEGPCAPSD